jgi:uncharacterized protein YbjT (DUF2867 family)
MNITITGSLGNIGQRLVERLTSLHHRVTVITRDPQKKAAIEALGAIPATGSIGDYNFLVRTFTGADAVFIMIPPDPTATDPRAHIRETGEKYARAIAATGIRHVVNLSSIGSEQPGGPGPTSANYEVEHLLNALPDTHVLHLRPGMFYTNFLGFLDMIRYQNCIGNNFGPQVTMALTDPGDIAAIAAGALDQKSFTGKNDRYIVSDEKKGEEIAAILGRAIGHPDCRWIEFSDEQLLDNLVQNGIPQPMATVYIVEIGKGLREDTLLQAYRQNKPTGPGMTPFETFAQKLRPL